VDEEQQRHEQLMYRLDTIEKHVLRMDTQLVYLADQAKIINRLVRDIEYLGYGIIVAVALYLGYLIMNYFLPL
jgi:tetrahydromethanopterin S-methyltransferase subunit G